MEIVEVNNNWNEEVLHLDITISNVCNYKCWYCWPGSNLGTHKFPNAEIFKKNILHLVRYYQNNTNKKIFDIHFSGGEPSHWPALGEIINFCKENFPCLISMTSNGSKKLSWWKKYGKYFDRVQLSCHHQYVDLPAFRDLCDWLYEQNVIVSVSVPMDSLAWQQCIDCVDFLKKSKRKWTIRYQDLVDQSIKYTPNQLKILKKYRARRSNIFWFLKNNKYQTVKVTVKDNLNKTYKVQDNKISVNKMNNFQGWKCSIGVNWIHVSADGKMACTRGQQLFGEKEYYNLYDANFIDKFKPVIKSTICQQTDCVCSFETTMPKIREQYENR